MEFFLEILSLFLSPEVADWAWPLKTKECLLCLPADIGFIGLAVFSDICWKLIYFPFEDVAGDLDFCLNGEDDRIWYSDMAFLKYNFK